MVIGSLPYAVEKIDTISGERFFRAIERGSPIYDVDTLGTYVEEDLRLLAVYKPDVVVGDFRLSLDVSARLAKVPYATVTNAYWSPYAKNTYPVPELPINKLFGVRAGQMLFDLFRPVVSRLHARPFNQLRTRRGLEPIEPDIRVIYTHADYTLYADLPELVPMNGRPANHQFLGPVLWSPSHELPHWWNELPSDRPIAYVTPGSSGHANFLENVLEALAEAKIPAIVATAGRSLKLAPRENVWLAEYLPGERAAARANLVICNGGSPTCYQALAAGVPIVGIATNLDQYLNMSLIDRAGAGILIRAGQASAARLRCAFEQILGTSSYRDCASALQQASRAHAAGKAFTSFLDGIAAHA
jgi:UDP:flavonoid glycosyltransferase YjiC (YdhE family)